MTGSARTLVTPIHLGGKLVQVVGVMPENFPQTFRRDLWIPLQAPYYYDGENTLVFGRLRPGVAAEQANAEVSQLLTAYRQSYTDGRGVRLEDETIALTPLWSHVGRGYRPILLTLLSATAVLLLIGCVNLANLLLAHGAGRVREVALRAALGAGRGRLVRQLVMESLVLARRAWHWPMPSSPR